MIKKLACFILRKEIGGWEEKSALLQREAYDKGIQRGYGLGKIAGQAEERNMGCILGAEKYDIQAQADKIVEDKEFE